LEILVRLLTKVGKNQKKYLLSPGAFDINMAGKILGFCFIMFKPSLLRKLKGEGFFNLLASHQWLERTRERYDIDNYMQNLLFYISIACLCL
jgi:hypothetical protein